MYKQKAWWSVRPANAQAQAGIGYTDFESFEGFHFFTKLYKSNLFSPDLWHFKTCPYIQTTDLKDWQLLSNEYMWFRKTTTLFIELVVKQYKDRQNQIAISYFVNFNILNFFNLPKFATCIPCYLQGSKCLHFNQKWKIFETQTWFMCILTCMFSKQNKTKWTMNIEF